MTQPPQIIENRKRTSCMMNENNRQQQDPQKQRYVRVYQCNKCTYQHENKAPKCVMCQESDSILKEVLVCTSSSSSAAAAGAGTGSTTLLSSIGNSSFNKNNNKKKKSQSKISSFTASAASASTNGNRKNTTKRDNENENMNGISGSDLTTTNNNNNNETISSTRTTKKLDMTTTHNQSKRNNVYNPYYNNSKKNKYQSSSSARENNNPYASPSNLNKINTNNNRNHYTPTNNTTNTRNNNDTPTANGGSGGVSNNWIYPVHPLYPIREYQLKMTETAIFHNTLVSLPTGLGKTLIAAVVMYNYYRWFAADDTSTSASPSLSNDKNNNKVVVFCAPTRPLVTQQIEACYNIVPIPMTDIAEISGKVHASKRNKLWRTRKVFFCTPQTLQKDIQRYIKENGDGSSDNNNNREEKAVGCNPQSIVCIVLDEAHKAKGNYAYCKVLQMLKDSYDVHAKNEDNINNNNNKSNHQNTPNKNMNSTTESNALLRFRVLGLSATPGVDVKAIQQVIENLYISKIEARIDADPDVAQYTHERDTEVIIIPHSDSVKHIDKKLTDLLIPFVKQIKDFTAPRASVENASSFSFLKARDDYHMNNNADRSLDKYFYACQSIATLRERLRSHGVGPLKKSMMDLISKSNGRAYDKLLSSIVNGDAYRDIFQDVCALIEGGPHTTQNNGGNNSHHHQKLSSSSSPQENALNLKRSNPKLSKLCEILTEHFERAQIMEKSSRVIVFAQWRTAVDEIVSVLSMSNNNDDRNEKEETNDNNNNNNNNNNMIKNTHSSPLLRPTKFIGQGKQKDYFDNKFADEKDDTILEDDEPEYLQTFNKDQEKQKYNKTLLGMNQKQQQEVMGKFKSNEFNIIVCTCIGEEGLDIGEVDLIVNYDCLRSPIRMIQRVGRTGRKRDGRVVILLNQGDEEKKYKESVSKTKMLGRALKDTNVFQCYRPYPRDFLPLALSGQEQKKPTLFKKTMEEKKEKFQYSQIGGYRNTDTPDKNKGTPLHDRRQRKLNFLPANKIDHNKWKLTPQEESERLAKFGPLSSEIMYDKEFLIRTRSMSTAYINRDEESHNNDKVAIFPSRFLRKLLRSCHRHRQQRSNKDTQIISSSVGIHSSNSLVGCGTSLKIIHELEGTYGKQPRKIVSQSLSRKKMTSTRTKSTLNSSYAIDNMESPSLLPSSNRNKNEDEESHISLVLPSQDNSSTSSSSSSSLGTQLPVAAESPAPPFPNGDFEEGQRQDDGSRGLNISDDEESILEEHNNNHFMVCFEPTKLEYSIDHEYSGDQQIEEEKKQEEQDVQERDNNIVENGADHEIMKTRESQGSSKTLTNNNKGDPNEIIGTKPKSHPDKLPQQNENHVFLENIQHQKDSKEENSCHESDGSETFSLHLPSQMSSSSSSSSSSSAASSTGSVNQEKQTSVSIEQHNNSEPQVMKKTTEKKLSSSPHNQNSESMLFQCKDNGHNDEKEGIPTDFRQNKPQDLQERSDNNNSNGFNNSIKPMEVREPSHNNSCTTGHTEHQQANNIEKCNYGTPINYRKNPYKERPNQPFLTQCRNPDESNSSHTNTPPPNHDSIKTSTTTSCNPEHNDSHHDHNGNEDEEEEGTPIIFRRSTTNSKQTKRKLQPFLSQYDDNSSPDYVKTGKKKENPSHNSDSQPSLSSTFTTDDDEGTPINFRRSNPYSKQAKKRKLQPFLTQCSSGSNNPDDSSSLLSFDSNKRKKAEVNQASSPFVLSNNSANGNDDLEDTPQKNGTATYAQQESTSYDDEICVICKSPDYTADNPIVYCDGITNDKTSSCNLAVHKRCYDIQVDVDKVEHWRCDVCKEKKKVQSLSSSLPSTSLQNFATLSCKLCQNKGGIFKKCEINSSNNIAGRSNNYYCRPCNSWVHPICSHFNVGRNTPTSGFSSCAFCFKPGGIKCSVSKCDSYAHPYCAMENNKSNKHEKWTLIRHCRKPTNNNEGGSLFCPRHSNEADDMIISNNNEAVVLKSISNKNKFGRYYDESNINVEKNGIEEKEKRIQARVKERQRMKQNKFFDMEAGIESDDDMEGDEGEDSEIMQIESQEENGESSSFINDSSQLGFATQDSLDVAEGGNHSNNGALHRELNKKLDEPSMMTTPVLNRRMKKINGGCDDESPYPSPHLQGQCDSALKGLGKMHFVRSVIDHHRKGGTSTQLEKEYHKIAQFGSQYDNSDHGSQSQSPMTTSLPSSVERKNRTPDQCLQQQQQADKNNIGSNDKFVMSPRKLKDEVNLEKASNTFHHQPSYYPSSHQHQRSNNNMASSSFIQRPSVPQYTGNTYNNHQLQQQQQQQQQQSSTTSQFQFHSQQNWKPTNNRGTTNSINATSSIKRIATNTITTTRRPPRVLTQEQKEMIEAKRQEAIRRRNQKLLLQQQQQQQQQRQKSSFSSSSFSRS